MNAKQIIDEAEGQLWLGDAEPDALHEHNRKVIAAAIEEATEQIRKQMDFLAKDLAESRAAHASEPQCPFCGGQGVLLSTGDIPKYQKLWIQCNDCGAQGPRCSLAPATADVPSAYLRMWTQRNPAYPLLGSR